MGVFARQRWTRLDAEGRIWYPDTTSKRPTAKALSGMSDAGQVVRLDLDGHSAHQQYGDERLGYPTQKPLALLERIISASSNEGDVVLDPFCGCGTAVHAAQSSDGAGSASTSHRSPPTSSAAAWKTPSRPQGADRGLAHGHGRRGRPRGPRRQVPLPGLGGYPGRRRPAGGERKKGADKGVDGVIPFMDGNTPRRGIISVKAGNTGPAHVRELAGTVAADDDAMFGVFVCLYPPTKPMTEAALEAGQWVSEFDGAIYPRMQILSAQDLIEAKQVRMPPSRTSIYAQAGREKTGRQPRMI